MMHGQRNVKLSDYYSRHFCISISLSVRIFVCLTIRIEQLGSHQMDFHEICYLVIFGKSVEKIQHSFKSDKNNGYFTWGPSYVYDNISLNS
jgi:hypothetical protein